MRKIALSLIGFFLGYNLLIAQQSLLAVQKHTTDVSIDNIQSLSSFQSLSSLVQNSSLPFWSAFLGIEHGIITKTIGSLHCRFYRAL